MGFVDRGELESMGFMHLAEGVQLSSRVSVYGASRISIGEGSRIDDFCVLSAGSGGIYIGRNVHIATMCTLIGRGRIEIRDFAGLSGRVSVYSSNDDYTGAHLTNPTVPDACRNTDDRDVVVDRHAIVGAGTVVLPGVWIGEGAAVGALSVVNRSLDAFGVYVGQPAKRIRERSRALLALEAEFIRGAS
jgi:galactoside O-acetyltransferase